MPETQKGEAMMPHCADCQFALQFMGLGGLSWRCELLASQHCRRVPSGPLPEPAVQERDRRSRPRAGAGARQRLMWGR
jgi:hypothetical protein